MKTQNHYFTLSRDFMSNPSEYVTICVASVLPEDRVLQILNEHYRWCIRPSAGCTRNLSPKVMSLEEAIIMLRTSLEVIMYETRTKLIREEKKTPYNLSAFFTIEYAIRDDSKVIMFTPKLNSVTPLILNLLCKPDTRRRWLRHTLACLLDEKSDSHIKLFTDKKLVRYNADYPIYEYIEAYYIKLSDLPDNIRFAIDNHDLIEIKEVSSVTEVKEEALPTNPDYIMFL